MRYIKADLKRPIQLGRRGENGVTTVQFPISVFFPDIEEATFHLTHCRAGEVVPYPCETMYADGVLEWLVLKADLDRPGAGVLQLTAYGPDDEIGKSIILTSTVEHSLGEEGEAPEAEQSWFEALESFAARAEAGAAGASAAQIAAEEAKHDSESARDVAEDAADDAESSKNAAQTAQARAETAAAQAEAAIQLGLTGASVGDIVRVKTVDANGKPTSWSHVPLCDITTNPSLLVNGYFVGGGSQQGDGIFPINQRGQANYPGTVFGVDRWKGGNANISVTLAGEHLSINNADQSNTRYLTQYLQSPDMLRGKTVTGSILLANGELYTGTNTIPETIPDEDTTITLKVFDTNRIRLANLKNGSIRFDISVKINSSLLVKAVKLELGTEQTLAHQENGVWVLNEIPDYGQELARCQRYLLTIASNSAFRCCVRTGNYFDFWVPTPVSMASSVTVLGAENCQIHEFGGNVIDGFSYSVPIVSNNGVRFRATKSSHGGTDADLRTTGKVWLSAE